MIITEMMLQLAEISSQNLTDGWTDLERVSRIVGSQVCAENIQIC